MISSYICQRNIAMTVLKGNNTKKNKLSQKLCCCLQFSCTQIIISRT